MNLLLNVPRNFAFVAVVMDLWRRHFLGLPTHDSRLISHLVFFIDISRFVPPSWINYGGEQTAKHGRFVIYGM